MALDGQEASIDLESGLHLSSIAYESDDCIFFSLNEDEHSEAASEEKLCSNSSISDFSVKLELKVILEKAENECRICHLSLENHSQESGIPIALGCSCKGDLAAAHKQCAETWFKIKGSMNCEICGSTVNNLISVDEIEPVMISNELNNNSSSQGTVTRTLWQGHQLINSILACTVLVFGICWVFNFMLPRRH